MVGGIERMVTLYQVCVVWAYWTCPMSELVGLVSYSINLTSVMFQSWYLFGWLSLASSPCEREMKDVLCVWIIKFNWFVFFVNKVMSLLLFHRPNY